MFALSGKVENAGFISGVLIYDGMLELVDSKKHVVLLS